MTGRSVPLVLPSHRQTVPEKYQPRRNYDLLAAAIGAIIRFPDRSDTVSRLETHFAFDLRQAIAAARQENVSIYISLSEKIGLPLALLLSRQNRHIPHIVIAHRMDTSRKRLFLRLLRGRGITYWVTLCAAQTHFLQHTLYVPQQVYTLWDAVDTHFFQPYRGTTDNYLLAVGQERRDWRTLLAAVAPLGLPLSIVAGSSFQASDTAQQIPISQGRPPKIHQNITVHQLRALYAGAAAVVVPILPGTTYAAGVNGLMEAMAAGKTIIATETEGLSGYLHPSAHHIVPAGDSDALREAIRSLECRPHWGDTARRLAEERHSLERYVALLAALVREATG